MGDGDAEQALLEGGGAVEAHLAIVREKVGESAAELVEEQRRQAGAAGVQVPQIGEQVLLGAVTAVVLRPGGRLAAEEGGDVHEGAEDLLFPERVAGRARPRGGSGEQALHPAGIGVVALDEAPDLRQR